MSDAYKISFREGDLKTFKITVPNVLNMVDKTAKIQVRREPGSPVIMEFSTNDNNKLLGIRGQVLYWVIPGFLSIGKAGIFQWEIAIYSNITNQKRYARGVFEITPSITMV